VAARRDRAARTAVLFILKDDQQAQQGCAYYTMVVSFMDINYLPPYLPAVHFKFMDQDVKDVRDALSRCKRVYEDCVDGLREYDESAKAEVIGNINRISSVLYRCNAKFDQVMNLISKLGVKNLIIFTNDRELPWSWAYADDNYGDVLCERYACGVIFAEQSDGLGRIGKYIEDKAHLHARMADTIALLIGTTCDLTNVDDELSTVERILTAQRDERGLPRKLRIPHVNRLGDGNDGVNEFRQVWTMSADMKIIHFAGHIEDDQLVAGGYRITSAELDRMGDFRAHPVVFLNGCSSGEIRDLFDAGAQMCTKFLKKLAQACVVNVMPIQDDIARYLSTEFYTRTMGARDNTIQSLGQALQGIRRDMRDLYPDDPQRLFFQLYGDPRSVFGYVGASDFIGPLITPGPRGE